MKHVVIGTAGHIDHGKSALVLALTGTDPDRLQEEKTRGITTDLGFAHTIEDDVALSFVDVPGHERFVRNMLAGVGGMDLVMLHVAADESVMPQTREHFDICRLLRVPAGLVVLTKTDLVDPETIDVVRMEVQDLVAGSFLDGAPVLAISARTGHGVPELRQMLAGLAVRAASRPAEGPPRLPIDRVFSIRGFGTVVTGTLVAGRIGAEDELVLLPSGRRVKVRGVQVHGERRGEGVAGQRVAANLAGIEVAEIERGETLTAADAVTVTRRLDVHIELLPSARPLRHGARVRFHQGTRELLGRIALASDSRVDAGGTAFGRINLEAPAVVVRGDRFILRAYSPLATIGGGTVLDPAPARRSVRTAVSGARFQRLSDGRGDASEAVMVMIEEAGLSGMGLSQLGSRAGVPQQDRDSLVALLAAADRAAQVGPVLVARSHLAAVQEVVLSALAEYHAEHPLEQGLPREELRERLFSGAPVAVFEHVLESLVAAGQVVGRDRLALRQHSLALSDEEVRVRDALVSVFNEAALTPPDRAELAARVAASGDVVERMSTLLVRQHVLVRLSGQLFHEAALERLKAEIRALKQQGAGATIDVGWFKQRYQVTRKYAIPLLEFLDRERVTRRIGDVRQII